MHGNSDKAVVELRDLLQQVQSEDAQRHSVRYRLKWLTQSHLARIYAARGEAAKAEEWFQRGIVTVEEAAKRMKRVHFRTAIGTTYRFSMAM